MSTQAACHAARFRRPPRRKVRHLACSWDFQQPLNLGKAHDIHPGSRGRRPEGDFSHRSLWEVSQRRGRRSFALLVALLPVPFLEPRRWGG